MSPRYPSGGIQFIYIGGSLQSRVGHPPWGPPNKLVRLYLRGHGRGPGVRDCYFYTVTCSPALCGVPVSRETT